MSINLAKRAETVGIVLAKRNIPKPPAVKVGAALDITGSAKPLYENGVIQETVDRMLAIALKFDDNGEIDIWTFADSVSRLDTATADDYGNFVDQKILRNPRISKWGMTYYAPVIEDILDFYYGGSDVGFFGKLFGKKSVTPQVNNAPAMAIFITDGANYDKDAAKRALQLAQTKNIYFQMVGVGPENEFGFIKEMADMLPNVGFINLAKLDMPDEEIFEQLISEEFSNWIKKI